ncbi:fibronectin type III domain-containing protein [Blautia obeum]|uniref:Fibronectin type III domain-containing protein n=2 Tax=Blautia obeum TaxID=40520 RepID=A0A367FZ31_9FIRM|nr:fibronectin type III domain-containing protein [Blautia obeum]
MNMKKWFTKIGMILVVMVMCIVGFGSVPVYASMEDDAMDYTLGETYYGQWLNEDCYKFALSKKSHVAFRINLYGSIAYDYIELYNSAGKRVFYGANLSWNYNNVKDISTGRVSRTLNTGTYYLKIDSERNYNFKITAEPLITLPRGTITSLKSNKPGQATVSCKAASNAIGYRIQYSTDYRFHKGVKTVYSPTRVKTLTKLTKGKRYYIKVCPYTVYDDGEHAFGVNSYVKSVYIKKK